MLLCCAPQSTAKASGMISPTLPRRSQSRDPSCAAKRASLADSGDNPDRAGRLCRRAEGWKICRWPNSAPGLVAFDGGGRGDLAERRRQERSCALLRNGVEGNASASVDAEKYGPPPCLPKLWNDLAVSRTPKPNSKRRWRSGSATHTCSARTPTCCSTRDWPRQSGGRRFVEKMKTAPMDCCYGSPLAESEIALGLRLAPLTLPRLKARFLKRGICEAILFTNAKRPASNCVCWASPPRRCGLRSPTGKCNTNQPTCAFCWNQPLCPTTPPPPNRRWISCPEQPFGRRRTRKKTRQTTRRRREGAQ